jgi:hypothetical protein
MCWLRAHRIIRIDLGVSYDRALVNNESGRHRQRPGIIAIVFGNIDAEFKV